MPQLQEELVEPYHPAHVRGNGPEQDDLSLVVIVVGVAFCDV